MDWREPWIRCLLGFHVAMLVLALATRKSETAQTIIFLALMCLVFGAERLNALARAHWRTFSAQNYFDEGGFFATTIFSGPLLVVLVVVLVNFLVIMTGEMVKTKRAQMQRDRRRRRNLGAREKDE